MLLNITYMPKLIFYHSCSLIILFKSVALNIYHKNMFFKMLIYQEKNKCILSLSLALSLMSLMCMYRKLSLNKAHSHTF